MLSLLQATFWQEQITHQVKCELSTKGTLMTVQKEEKPKNDKG